jgi:hypothetical protein
MNSDTFSYRSDGVYRRAIGGGLQMAIRRLDPNVARIGFEMEEGNAPVPIPDGVSVVLLHPCQIEIGTPTVDAKSGIRN